MAQQRFHHRHLPTLTRWIKATSWKFGHLFFPTIIHFLTDKYHGRTHHLIVDTIYSVIVALFVATNIGLGVWFYLYFTPAELDVRVFTNTQVVSGQSIPIAVQYLSPNRYVQDAEVTILLPPGFERDQGGGHEPYKYVLGDVNRFDAGVVELKGRVFGSVGTSYDIRAVVSYTSYGRRHFETKTHRFTVTDSPLDIQIEIPPVVAFDTPVEIKLHYNNGGDVDDTNVQLQLQLPAFFEVKNVNTEHQQLQYFPSTQIVQLPDIPAHTQGSLIIAGTFVTPTDQGDVGDQEQVFGVEAVASVRTPTTAQEELFAHGKVYSTVAVITPRIETTIDGDDVLNFGETLHTTVILKNISDRPLKNITPTATIEGAPARFSGATATDANGATTHVDGDTLTFPTIATLDPNATTTFTVAVPTAVVAGEQLSTTLNVSGTAFSPDINTTVTIPEQTWTTKYNSHVELSTDVLYTTADGEEIGYGPYPPEPWEVTAMRVIMSVRNNNNPLSTVRIRATLPSQVEWSNFASVSAGTSLDYNEQTREITWTIPTLEPQQTAYGAQFEIRFTPNHLQVGTQPHLLEPATITAQDAFTNTSLTQAVGAVLLPVAVTAK